MAIRVTEKWSGERASKKAPWWADREFDVTGTTDATEALTAIDAVSGLAIPQRDESHNRTSSLKCEGPEVIDRKGVDFITIGCHYSQPASGGFVGNETDPLLRAPRYRFGQWQITEPCDTDLRGRPMRNSAGDAFDPPPSRTIRGTEMSMTRYEPFWDIIKSKIYEGSTNSTDVIFSGIRFAAQHMLCDLIRPAEEMILGTPYTLIEYKFLILPEDVYGPDPWQYRLLDQGFRGSYSSSGIHRGRFASGKNEVFDEPIRLNGAGLPLPLTDSTVGIYDPTAGATTPRTVVAPEHATTVAATDNSTAYGGSSIEAVWLRFTKAIPQDFVGLI